MYCRFNQPTSFKWLYNKIKNIIVDKLKSWPFFQIHILNFFSRLHVVKQVLFNFDNFDKF